MNKERRLFHSFIFFSIALIGLQSYASQSVQGKIHWTTSLEACVSRLKTNEYAFNKSEFNCDKRLAKADCSGFFNRALEKYFPDKYTTATKLLRKSRLNTSDYFEIISQSGADRPFKKVNQTTDLQPGDFIVWKYTKKHNSQNVAQASHGHILLVVEAAKATSEPDIYSVKVIDSALSGHANDTRAPGVTGVGIGSVFIQSDKNGQPKAYGWSNIKNLVSENLILLGRIDDD